VSVIGYDEAFGFGLHALVAMIGLVVATESFEQRRLECQLATWKSFY